MSTPLQSTLALVVLVGAAVLTSPAPAQTPTATVKNNENSVILQAFAEGQLLLPGAIESGPIPATGEGVRMMWWPKEAAFRAGRVGVNKDGTQWNPSNVGTYSVAFGRDTKASGGLSTAMGSGTTASGFYSTAMGLRTTASVPSATAMGKLTTAATESSLSIGVCNDKNRGRDDDDFTTGPLFVVGKGSVKSGSCDSNSDALVLDQSGNLEVAGSFVLPDGTTLEGGDDLEGIPTNSNGASALDNDNGFLATGTTGSGSIPTSGAGTRMMWYPNKAAFRAGEVGVSTATDQWNASNVGLRSVAFGQDTKASGESATALGSQTVASDFAATAMGLFSKATGSSATAMGASTEATGEESTAMGSFAKAVGAHATAIGFRTAAYTTESISLGRCNKANNLTADGTLLVVGNGPISSGSCDSRSDALILDQDGNLEATGGFVLPDGTTLDGSEDLDGVPTNSNGASELDNEDGVLATGTFGSGSIPTSGAGTRMMWYPNKAAFRAGEVTGSDWDDSNIGSFSVAMGLGTTAKGDGDVAIGVGTLADGGSGTVASGGAVALGNDTEATAAGATAFGHFTTASGLEATAMGYNTTAATDKSLSIGEYNSANTSEDNSLFVAGNGTGSSSRSDALVLDKDAGLLVNGALGTGSIPATGAGTRMMWYPGKAAFRAGEVGGSQWDNSNVGEHSAAFGENVTASGQKSFAAGLNASATNVETVALGKNVNATGTQAVAIGQGADAGGSSAVALGSNTSSGGVASTALGRHTQAETDASLSVGKYNNANTSDDNTLFVVGDGSSGDPSDALRLDESGNFSIDGVVNNDVGGGPAMHFQREFGAADDDPQNYVALIENTVGDLGDGLAIKAGEDAAPDSDVNYIGFFQGDGDPAGKIEGDAFGGVLYESTGSDYAEELPIAEGSSKPEAADLVGVRSGEASLETDGADRVMIVSTAPIMLGNGTPSTEADDDRRVKVAFIGQVPARVRGAVEPGDLVVASGKNDGTARAVAPGNYRRAEHGPIAGQAWESKSSAGVDTVTVAVGLGRNGAVAKRLQAQQAQISALKQKNKTIRARQKTLEERLARLEARSSGPVLAGLPGSGLLLGLLLGGLFGAGVLWRRRA